MITIIVAVYVKSVIDYTPLVGVFKNGLENEPAAIYPLKLNRNTPDVEKRVAEEINTILSGFSKEQRYQIDFFNGTKIIKNEDKKIIFIEASPYFCFQVLLDNLELF